MTRQRRILMETLRDLGNHPTADELYDAAKKKLPGISKGTVYRNLQVLTEQHDVSTINTPAGIRHYDHMTHDHYHIQCTRCGRLADVSVPGLKVAGLKKAQASGYVVTGHILELFGICPECSGKIEQQRQVPEMNR